MLAKDYQENEKISCGLEQNISKPHTYKELYPNNKELSKPNTIIMGNSQLQSGQRTWTDTSKRYKDGKKTHEEMSNTSLAIRKIQT